MEISPMKATLIHAYRQTDKYEAIWRFCDCTNAQKSLMWQPWSKTFKESLKLRVNQWGQETKICFDTCL